MSDDSTATISGTFATREAADRAVEHLVQEHGIDRADIFVQAENAENTSGSAPSGGDVAGDDAEGSSFRPVLTGRIQVSADVNRDEIAKAQQAFRGADATDVMIR